MNPVKSIVPVPFTGDRDFLLFAIGFPAAERSDVRVFTDVQSDNDEYGNHQPPMYQWRIDQRYRKNESEEIQAGLVPGLSRGCPGLVLGIVQAGA